jgi:hypothetical protein
MGEYPRTDSVEILMSVPVAAWHGVPMPMTGGEPRGACDVISDFVVRPGGHPPPDARGGVAVGGVSPRKDVPIVIAGSPVFPHIGGVHRVFCVAVMVALVMTARATRVAVERSPAPTAHPAAARLCGAP